MERQQKQVGPQLRAQERPPEAARAYGGEGGGGTRELEDALHYLDCVKRAFYCRPEVYEEFVSIMTDFKRQQVDTPGVIAKVHELFHGNDNLIQGFNKFLPEGYDKAGIIAEEPSHKRQRSTTTTTTDSSTTMTTNTDPLTKQRNKWKRGFAILKAQKANPRRTNHPTTITQPDNTTTDRPTHSSTNTTNVATTTTTNPSLPATIPR